MFQCVAWLVYVLFVSEVLLRTASESTDDVNSTTTRNLLSPRFKWCPDSLCTPENPLCAQKWLFILSTGRSGSTTLLETMNLIPNIRLIGEHAGALNFLFDMVHAANVTDPRRLQEVQLLLQDILAHLDPPSKKDPPVSRYRNVLGFKELRYSSAARVKSLKQVFPCSRFIFNFREDTGAQIKSGFFAQKSNSKTVEYLEGRNTEEKELYALYKSSSYLMPLEDFSPWKFTAMLKWLVGPSFNCSYSNICHSNADGSYKTCAAVAKADPAQFLEGNCSFDPHELVNI